MNSTQRNINAIETLCQRMRLYATEDENREAAASAEVHGPKAFSMAMHPENGTGFAYFPASMIGNPYPTKAEMMDKFDTVIDALKRA